jgi:EAL domain-containing protein (putative c-di-GMP-specific phosphodiesterase class I)
MSSRQGSQKKYKSGEIIMQQGEKGESAYIIEDGLVEITIEKEDGAVHQVGTRGPGTIIGEMAIVDDAPRTATVKAIHDCTMLEITQDDFKQRLNGADPVIQMVAQVILTRYRDLLTRTEIFGSKNDRSHEAEALERSHANQHDALETIKIANEFKEAIDNDDLELYYQPMIDLKKGMIVGFEALMRWNHAERGFVSPGLFIPVAEKSGLIVEASKWALAESCRALKRIEDHTGRADLFMSVNFSSSDFADPSFIDNIYKILSETDVQAKQIHLEITERLLIQQPDNAKDVLQLCRDAGMHISIDDFGTGYSSLSYLYYFPIDTLKIDQSFIRAMNKEEASLELVKSIIGLGKNMNMDVVAEGVEEIEEAKTLQDLGCDKAQGYYFARPVPEAEVIEIIRSWEPAKLSA